MNPGTSFFLGVGTRTALLVSYAQGLTGTFEICTIRMHVSRSLIPFAHDTLRVHAQLNPEEKLLRVLLRTDCDGVRKSMLRDQLQLPNHDIFLVSPPLLRGIRLV